MKVIYKDSTQQIEKEYPNIDISQPVIGLDASIKYYCIQEIIPENPNPNKYDLIRKPDKLTTKKHELYSHLLICERVYELVEKSQDEIIERLNTELGNYLDTEYPLWERTKHAGEGNYILLAMINNSVTDEQLERKSYIDSIYAWITNCRAIRAQREKDYLENNVFPEFNNYPLKP